MQIALAASLRETWNGGRTTAPTERIVTTLADDGSSASVADVDGDGDVDLALTTNTGDTLASERFLDSPVARVLAARPDLARSKHLATRFYDRETVLDDLEAHGPVVERFVKARYSIFVVTAGTFLLIPEFMQDVVFAEVCDLLPYLTSKLLRGFIEFDSVGGRRQGSGAAVVSIALLAVLLSVFFAFNLIRWVDERILCTTTPTPDAALDEEGSLSPLPRLEIGPPEEAGADLFAAPREVAPRDDAEAPAPGGDTQDVPDDGGDVVAAAEI